VSVCVYDIGIHRVSVEHNAE